MTLSDLSVLLGDIAKTEDELNRSKKRAVDLARNIYLSKSVPLDERIKVFLSVVDYLDAQSYIIDLNYGDKKEISWYHDFYFEKYQTILVKNIIESLIDDDYYNSKFTKEEQNEIIEKLIEFEIKSFCIDW